MKNNQKFLTPTQTTTTDQYSPVEHFAVNNFSKQQHLQAPKPERPLHFFTKSLATVTMSSTY